jgi:hypothetical protein
MLRRVSRLPTYPVHLPVHWTPTMSWQGVPIFRQAVLPGQPGLLSAIHRPPPLENERLFVKVLSPSVSRSRLASKAKRGNRREKGSVPPIAPLRGFRTQKASTTHCLKDCNSLCLGRFYILAEIILPHFWGFVKKTVNGKPSPPGVNIYRFPLLPKNRSFVHRCISSPNVHHLPYWSTALE